VDKKGQPTMTSHLHSPRSKAAQGDRREKQDKKTIKHAQLQKTKVKANYTSI